MIDVAHADVMRYFRVTPPSVNQMLIPLEREGLIRRQPGVASSVELLIDPGTLPQLLPCPGQPVKTTVQRYPLVNGTTIRQQGWWAAEWVGAATMDQWRCSALAAPDR